jgi:hypothetical protein
MTSPSKGNVAHEEGLGMAKQGKLRPARKQRDQPQDEGSVLLRSAVSIGRVIGSLQRQLDGARVRFGESAADTSKDAASRSQRNGRIKPKPKAILSAKASKPRANGRKAATSGTAKKKGPRKSH